MPFHQKVIFGSVYALIVGTLLMIKLGGRQGEARLTAAHADIQAYGQALDLYELDNGLFPTTGQGLKALETKPAVAPEPRNWKGYLKTPLRNDPWDRPYVYQQPGQHNPHKCDLYSLGPDGAEGTEDDITNWK